MCPEGCRSPGPRAAKSETSWGGVPNQALHPLALQGQRQAGGFPAGPCTRHATALQGGDRHESPRLDPASCPAAKPLARAAEIRWRGSPAAGGGREKKSKVSTAKGSRIWRCCKWSLDTRNGLVSGLPWPPRSSPGAVASASWALLLAPPDPGHPGSFSS